MENNKHPYQPEGSQQPKQQGTQVIPVVEEYATIHQEVITTGKVLIRKTVSEEQALINLPITNETYDIERVAVHEVRDTPPPSVRYEGDTMIIPVTKEITVIQKRYEVVEELRITRKLTETPVMQEITLRKEAVHIQRHRNENRPEQF